MSAPRPTTTPAAIAAAVPLPPAPHRRAAPFGRLALAATIGLAAVNVLGIGASASWTDTDADDVAIANGTLDIALGTAGTTGNRLDVAAVDIAPGDTIERAVDLHNVGSIDLGDVLLSTTSATGSALFTGADGLDLRVARCDVPWTEATTADGAPTYTCGGTTAWALGSAASWVDVAQGGTSLAGVADTAPGATAHLVVTLTLPTSADDTYQGLGDVVGLRFDAVQRTGTSR